MAVQHTRETGTYFDGLNYTIGNEDTSLEYALMPEHINHAVVVAGSGARVIPLIARGPATITCVDTSSAQLALTQTRVETMRTCTHEDFLSFWEYGSHTMTAKKRREIFTSLSLPDEVYKKMNTIFESNQWRSILYAGKWERTFQSLAKINRLVTGARALALFDYVDRNAYNAYFRMQFPHQRWRTVVRLLGNSLVFNQLLYRGHFPHSNLAVSASEYYLQAFDRICAQCPVRLNFFMQILFFGRVIYDEGLPLECDPHIYIRAQQSVRSCEIEYIQAIVPDFFKTLHKSVQFVSLSDIASYFSPPHEQSFMQIMRPCLEPGTRVVNRYYLRTPERLDIRGYIDVTHKHAHLIAQEKIQMYHFQILEMM